MAASALKGIHHVSAMTARAVNNHDFYTHVMGMRLVKKTVNQDDTSMYHLFYGDEKGNPGTELTFFELPMMGRNRDGVSSISTTSLRIPTDASISWWVDRFDRLGVEHDEPQERDGKLTLDFRDPEGQRMRLISDERNVGVPAGIAWEGGPVPAEHGVLGLGPVRLTVADAEPTLRVLTELMGFRRISQYPADVPGQPDIVVVEVAEGGSGAGVHVEERHDLDRERLGRGGVHHVAFRVEDEEALREWAERIGQAGFHHSGYVDRYYFRSLYFREPSGILFELATDGPGFDTDEPLDSLGEALALPPFLEPKREAIEAKLKPLPTAKG
ncbi:ring-cleaving dioxygenase [Paenibacillus albicereus]|uniref:Ring-cleaving dioxygenase n=1 Tax=Paenibacillus albicereus TaxID=2726185 RepID=A0A6H2GTS2_9BACL|nr:ring-cleaving dioxygenase [Paenibacillus albicereus]QJC50759.1 ring-cleaving dioxygenase [Paenibacillus albicereus]